MVTVHRLALAVAAVGAALLGRAPLDGRAALDSACQAGSHPERCVDVADGIERGAVGARFDEEPGLYLALACEQGAADACPRAGRWASRYPDYETLETDVGCMLEENAFACEEVADALRGGDDDGRPPGGARTGPRRPDAASFARAAIRTARALALYAAGCDRGEAASCLGVSRIRGDETGDGAAAEAKACALGLGAACERAGDRLPGDDAVPLYRRACDLPPGSPHACLKLARAYEATGAPAAIVAASYRLACERLAVDACAWMTGGAAVRALKARTSTAGP